MLILHAAHLQGNMVLWAEDSDPQGGPPEREKAGEHPHCARAQLLAEAVGLETGDSNFGSAIAWLPTLGNAPVPSSPLAGAIPRSRAKPRIRPWAVTTLRLRPEHAVPLLQACHGQLVLKHGVAIGTDLAYWTHVLQLAVSMTARQQFLPSLSERDGHAVATWIPVFIGQDAHRLAELAALMPASARALTAPAATDPPPMAAKAILREFLAARVDHLARAGAEADGLTQPEFDSAHDAWLWALDHSNPAVISDLAQIQQLRRQVANGRGRWPLPTTPHTGSASGWRSHRMPARRRSRPQSGRRTGTCATCFNPTTTSRCCSRLRQCGKIRSTDLTRTSTRPSSC